MPELILDPYLRNAALDALMDGTLLWVAAGVMRQRPRWYRLFCGALVGGLYNFWLALAQGGFLPGWSFLSSPLILLVGCPAAMLAATFSPVSWRRFLRLGGVVFVFALISWGLANALQYFLSYRGYEFSGLLFVVLEMGFALATAELGWGIVHQRVVARVCQVRLLCELGDTRIETDGYLDTGNHLRDPVTRRPVVVLDYAVARVVLTPAARAFVEAVATGGEPPDLPDDDPWLPRLRVIPYRSVARRAGLMPGLRTDRIFLGSGTQRISHRSVVVGLELAGGLAAEDCHALVPPSLWSPAFASRQERGRSETMPC